MNDQDNSLYTASKVCDIEAMIIALKNGADVNVKGLSAVTPLHLASTRSREMSDLLIAHGADVNAKDGIGWTPLHWAVNSGREDVAKFLIERGADVNVRDKYGVTPTNVARDVVDIRAILYMIESERLARISGSDAKRPAGRSIAI